MEKIKLNNQVILMRKFVKQAKVHAINKLVKGIKNLQNRKGDEAKIQKAKRKAERCLEEIKLIKKIKPDDVSKSALSMFKNWQDVLKEKSSTLEERCFALLANYGAVQKEVVAFHSSNQNLVPKIPDLIKQMEQRSKLPKYSRKGPNSSGVQSKIDGSKIKRSDKSIELSQNSSSLKKNYLQIKINVNENSEESSNQFACESNVKKTATFIDDIDSKAEKVKNNESPSKHKMENKKKALEYKDEISPVLLSKNEESDEESCSDDVSEDEIEKEKSNINKGNSTESESSEDISDNDMDKDMLNSKQRKPWNNQTVKKVPDYEISDTENHKISNDMPSILGKVQQDSCQNFKVSTKMNLKAITKLNLDDLEGLDKIPVNKPDEFKETKDDNIEDPPQKKKRRSDSFFLEHDSLNPESDDEHDEDNQTEKPTSFKKNERSNFRNNLKRGFEKSNFNKRDFKNSNNFKKNFEKSSNYKKSFEKSNNFKRDFQKSSNFTKGFEKSSNFKRDFQKSPNTSQFSRESYKYKGERNNFKKVNFQSKNYQEEFKGNKFHLEDQRNFKRENDFQRGTFEKKSQQGLNKLYLKKEGNNSFRKDKVSNKKGNEGDKPLHPSWEAKRKQKELTHTPFQGKRMVFED